jgi:hypothetical protein
MSDLRINIRILMWHLQVTGGWKISWTYNDYHKGLKHGWFACYEFKPFKDGPFSQDQDCAHSDKSN